MAEGKVNIDGSRVLVTGGAGLIGSYIVEALFKEKVKEVVVFDNFTRGRRENLKSVSEVPNVKIVEGDIRDKEILRKITQGVDYIFHTAAIRHILCQENPRLGFEILVEGTFNLLEVAIECKVKKIIFSSSALIYGDPKYLPIDEEHPLEASSVYGAGKLAGECFIRAFRQKYGLDYVILRYFNVYGPRMDVFSPYTEVMVKLIEKIEINESPILFGDGSQSMDFVYVEDVARANILALKSDVKEGAFNIGSGTQVSLNRLVNEILDVMNSKLKPIYKPREQITISHRQANIQKAQKILGFLPEVSLYQGVEQLINWKHEVLHK